jgi:hypothetical protein
MGTLFWVLVAILVLVLAFGYVVITNPRLIQMLL